MMMMMKKLHGSVWIGLPRRSGGAILELSTLQNYEMPLCVGTRAQTPLEEAWM